MMRRHPALVLLLCWSVFVALIVTADCLLKPAPVTLTEAPTRVPMVTVTPAPSATTFVFAPATREIVVLDSLPMASPSPTVTPREAVFVTRVPVVPTSTFTPIPTSTPKAAVQRG